MATIRMISYTKLLKIFTIVLLSVQVCQILPHLTENTRCPETPHAKFEKYLNFHIQTILSTVVVDVFISNQVY